MTTDKEELRKEISKFIGIFENEMIYNISVNITDLVYSKLEAKDKERAAKIAAGERLRMEDAMSAINEANELRQKIKDQELIIYGIEEGSAQWESLCHDKEKQITDLKAEVEWLKGALTSR